MKKPTQKAKQLTSTKLQKELKRVIPASMQKKAPTRIKGITPASKGKPFVDKVKLTETASFKKIKADNVRLIRQLEKQKRELEIEAALEKVRAAASAMVKTDELSKVVSVMYKQFESLEPNQIGIELILCDVAKDQLQFWSSSFSQKKLPERYTIQKESHPLFRKQWNAWKAKKDRLVIRLDETRYKEFCKFIFSQTDFKNFPDHVKKYIRSRKKDVFTHALMKYGLLEAVAAEVLSNDSFGVLQRFAKVFEQTYTRFLDLQKAEAQARESQVEAALERVRSRSLAMHNSEELREVVSLFYEQMELFGFAKGGCELILCNEKSGFLEYWHTNPVQSSVPECLNVSPGIHDFFDQVWKSWKNQEPQLVIEMRGKEKHKMDIALLEKTDFKKLDKKTKNWILSDKVAIFSHAIMKYGLLEAVDYLPLDEDQFSILQRFAKIFEQTYTRFLDLQKAEAQAREAQIEAALERVRSRSLAMHKSDELNEVIAVLYEQMQLLRVGDWGCSLNIYNEMENYFEIWLSTDAQRISPQSFRIEGQGHQRIKELWDIWKSQEQFRFIELKGADKVDYDEYVMSQTGLKHLPYNIKKAIKSLPETYASIAAMKHGTLNSYTGQNPFSKTEFLVLQRFAKVFEQAYTRFLDLQKAEAQAREAQIEAALERIRSRTMAMQKPDELLKVGGLLYKELSNLGVTSLNSGYTLVDKDGKMDWNYLASPEDGSIASKPLGAPRDETKVMRSMTASWERQEPFHVIELNPQETIRHQTYIAENLINFSITAEQLISVTPERLVLQTFNFEQGYLLIVGAEKLSDENVKMIVRFARVFEMTYKRFLDLQIAEAQAREAEIQLALERVRARTMAMHKSEELSEVVSLIYEQIQSLGLSDWGCSIIICDDKARVMRYWYAEINLPHLPEYCNVPLTNKIVKKAWKLWQSGVPKFDISLLGKEKESYTSFILNDTDYHYILPEEVKEEWRKPKDIFFSYFTFKYGMLEFVDIKPLNSENYTVYERFAKVFEQTYTRFLDLQKAEAQAREAQIEVALERVRAKAMAMQKPDELKGVALELRKQLGTLEQEALETCAIHLYEESPDYFISWAAMRSPKSDTEIVQTQNRFPKRGVKIIEEMMDCYHSNKKDYVLVNEGQKFKDFLKMLKELSPDAHKVVVNSIKKMKPKDVRAFWSLSDFKGGSLIMSTVALPDEATRALLRRFANVFSLAYQRFIDLQKAEAQTREAQINLAVERVRAKALAMHRSEEIIEVVAKLKDEVMDLNIPDVIATTIFLREGKDQVRMWDLSTVQKRDGGFELSLDIPFKLKEKDPHLYIKRVWENPENYCVELQDQKGFARYIAWLREHDKNQVADELKAYAESGLIHRIYHAAKKLNSGKLVIDLMDPPSAEIEIILTKMGAAFDLAYKRFEDIQKAEAQAREAQIEVALEKVRSASMAMHKSEELVQVVRVIDKEILGLGIETDGTQIFTDFSYKEKGVNDWFAKEGHDFLEKFHVPYLEHSLTKRLYDALAKGVDFYSDSYSKDEKNEFLKLIFTYSDFRTYPKESQDLIYNAPGLVRASVLSKNSILIFQHYDLKEFSKEEEEIFKRFGKVFEQAYTRFLDLQKAEAQAREAQIEVALEKVRSASMAMHKSEELIQVVRILDKAISGLGIEGSSTQILTDFANPENGYNVWVAVEGQDYLKKFHIPFIKHPILEKILTAIQKGTEFYTETYLKTEKNEFFKILFENSDYRAIPKERQNFLYSSPGLVRVVVISENSILIFQRYDLNEFSKEEEEIFKRFGKVFEQAYTRFLDLQKAEAQAREARIEAALERVRSASMATHKSEELQKVVSVLFEQLQSLDFALDGAAFIATKVENSQGFDFWMEDKVTQPSRFRLPYYDAPSINDLVEAWEKGKDFSAKIFGKEKNIWFKYAFEHTDLKIVPEDRKQWVLAQSYLTQAFALQKNSLIGIHAHYEKVLTANEIDILKRFSKVFEQSFVRFLDLQKAEAQAREAQIEAALERVRSASMAMHKSDDLLFVIRAVHEQITELGIEVDASNFLTFIENSRDIYLWAITNTHTYQQKLRVTYIDFGITKKMWDAWEKGKSFVEFQADADEMHRWWNTAFEVSELSHTPPNRREIILSAPGHTSIVAKGKTCALQLHRYNLESFTTQEHDILRRLATVFEQSYTRFLDLQKAENQARESQIEAALERVRSRSLAMHKSEELRNVVNTLYGEFQSLNVNFHVATIQLFPDDSKDMYLWLSTADGLYDDIIHWPFEDLPIFDEVYKSRATKVLEYTLDKRETEEFLESYFKLEAVPKERKDATRSVEVIDVFGSTFEKAGIFIMRYSEGAYSENEKDIIRRFAKVFEQTYIRFLDLQKAEAREKEAIKQSSLDRVRGEIASMRDAKDLERITPLVWSELKSLGVPFFRCGVMIVNEEDEVIDFYLSNPQGEALAALRLDYDNSDISRNGVAYWRKKETYVEHWDQAQFLTFMRSLMDQGQISNPTTYQGGEKPPTALTLQFVPFAQGMLYVGSEIDLNAEELDLVKALGKSLAVAYARYEDFTRLDIAKANAEKALKDLKSAQEQLVQQEKLASLGQLTAGIAHEIKNPLNFVNNFSDLSRELIEEVFAELENLEASATKEEIISILQDVQSNLTKVHEHGTRANGIVTSMLQHSRASGSKREPKAFNPLVKEFVNLSYHGMRAGKAPILVDIDLQLDPQVKDVILISEDFSRVILNLCNNAFDAMRDKLKTEDGRRETEDGNSYLPKLTVKTSLQKDKVMLSIADNGGGIPADIKDKILQPFFTTKKGTEGTGLGLSITNDIIKAHGGELRVESKVGEGSEFVIYLTLNN